MYNVFVCALFLRSFRQVFPPRSPRMFYKYFYTPPPTVLGHLTCGVAIRFFVLVIEHLHVLLNLGSNVFSCILVPNLQTHPLALHRAINWHWEVRCHKLQPWLHFESENTDWCHVHPVQPVLLQFLLTGR